MNVYVASSWRNPQLADVIFRIIKAGHQVYDFRNEETHFHWSELDGRWYDWSVRDYLFALDREPAVKAFKSDFDALKWADICVLVTPCGASSHLEAGYFIGKGKTCLILLDKKFQPELMYQMATKICQSIDQVIGILEELS